MYQLVVLVMIRVGLFFLVEASGKVILFLHTSSLFVRKGSQLLLKERRVKVIYTKLKFVGVLQLSLISYLRMIVSCFSSNRERGVCYEKILQDYELASVQAINLQKFEVTFSTNVSIEQRDFLTSFRSSCQFGI